MRGSKTLSDSEEWARVLEKKWEKHREENLLSHFDRISIREQERIIETMGKKKEEMRHLVKLG